MSEREDFPDRIERSVDVAASLERTWQAVTDPVELARWFPETIEMEAWPGGMIRFTWGDDTHRGEVVAVEPMTRFAYCWNPGQVEDPSAPFSSAPRTLVEFMLESVPSGTRVTVIESGFAALPVATRAKQHADNSQGWGEELGELQALFTAAPATA